MNNETKNHYEDQIDFQKINTFSIKERHNLVTLENMADPAKDSVQAWVTPELDELITRLRHTREAGRPIIWSLGAHVIKNGLSRYLIDLMRQGWITHLSGNGAVSIHDFELACWGKTSEDVQSGLEDGSFGMSRETADLINGAVIQGDAQELGFGESLGLMLNEGRFPHLGHSLLAACYRLKVPLTVHVAVGTDIVHQHPSADGAAIGSASHRDFRILAAQVARLSGGVVINLGSSVVLPEVFLKALTVARNTGHKVSKFTAANFDMIQHYRPNQNVVTRPVASGGRGYSITGHHEIMLPLLAAMIKHYQFSR